MQNDYAVTSKNGKPISFPLKLDITQHCSPELVNRGGGRFYASAVICHSGATMHCGHYWSCQRWSSGEWVKYNDLEVTPVTPEYVLGLKREAYMLVYDAVDTYQMRM